MARISTFFVIGGMIILPMIALEIVGADNPPMIRFEAVNLFTGQANVIKSSKNKRYIVDI